MSGGPPRPAPLPAALRRARAAGGRLSRNGLQLVAIASVGIAQQYLDPLSKASEFFVEKGATGLDVVVFALVLVLVPPLFLLGIEWLAGLVHLRLLDALHVLFIAALVALVVRNALVIGASTYSVPAVAAAAAAAGVLAGAAYVRFAWARSFFTALSVAPVLFLVLFLVFSPVGRIAFGGGGGALVDRKASGAPVVMVVFDEFPAVSLMDAHQRVDRRLYPNFAQLARQGTWYRNTVTVADGTPVAVPAILSGRVGSKKKLAIANDHPDSLFTLLGRSDRMDVFETVTAMCGDRACPERPRPSFVARVRGLLAASIANVPALPSVRDRLVRRLTPSPVLTPQEARSHWPRSVSRHLTPGRFDKETIFSRFLATLGPPLAHSLHYLHFFSPHRPWQLLPSGQHYTSARDDLNGFLGRWPKDSAAATIAYQRHLLEVGTDDRLLGRLIRRLRATGLYDRALLVIVADHGASFQAGDEARTVTKTNAAQVGYVPLFIKTPHQRHGGVSDVPLRSTDVLSMIARSLHTRVPWPTHPREPVLVIRRLGRPSDVAVSRRMLERRRAESLRHKLAVFGSSGRRLFRFGPRPELIGRRVADLRARPAKNSATLDGPPGFQDVDPAGPSVPADISGDIHGPGSGPRELAVALNGRIAATTWSLVSNGREHYTALVPPGAFRPGANSVAVYSVGGSSRTELTALYAR